MLQQNWQPRTRTWHDRKTSPVLLVGHFCRVWIINQYSVKFKFHVRAAANAMVWKPQIQEFSRILPLAGDPAQKLYGPPIGALVIISCITRPSDKGNRKISNIRHIRGKWISKRCLWRKYGQRQNGDEVWVLWAFIY